MGELFLPGRSKCGLPRGLLGGTCVLSYLSSLWDLKEVGRYFKVNI